MDWIWTFVVCCIALLGPALVLHRGRQSNLARLPPGPPGWPVFGNIFDLGSEPHKTMGGLKEKYGPVVWLRLGSINTVVLLTARAAAELFKNHDSNFVDRRVGDLMEVQGFGKASVSLLPQGPHWRLMKRVMTAELLGPGRMSEMEPIRRRCVSDMLEWIRGAGGGGGRAIHVARLVFSASFNVVGNLTLSRDLVGGPESGERSELFEAMVEILEVVARPNVMDLFPWLKRLDPQGLRRATERRGKTILKIIAGFVEQRLKDRPRESNKDYLDVLLDFEGNGVDEPRKISHHDITLLLLEVFFAGTETTSSTIEWVMVELLKHPEVMSKAKKEMGEVVGKGNKFEEKYMEKLPYMEAVVKETMRLHPPVPLLVPRQAIQETDNFMGYRIPKHTQLLVNAWAIGRDPECWDDPSSFTPERFLNAKIDYKGQNYELIPFGAGRRKCAGIPLGHRMLHLVLGSLLHEFEWRVDEIGLKGLMDTREVIGVTTRKFVPLEAIARPV